MPQPSNMTPHLSRKSLRIAVFSTIIVFAWTGVSLVVSGWILQSSGSPVWLALIGAACFAGAAGSWFVIFRADLARWRQNRRTLMGARAGMGTGGDELPARLAGTRFDVTDPTQTEEGPKIQSRLLESQKMESLGQLTGRIGHDFNNLLTAVLSNAELAELDLPTESPVTTRIHQIKQAAVRMAHLTREMLAYYGYGTFNVTRVDLGSLIREMSDLLATGVSKRVQLRYKFPDNPVVVESEDNQIRQVLINLITNASDAMNQQSGIITLTTGLVEADASDFEGLPWARELRSGCYAFFEVEDQGCGMTPETVRRMFEPYFTTKPNGRGLGLAAVQDIVRSHHGALRVRSAPGAGTAIRVLLPLPAETAGLPANAAPIGSS